MARRTNVSVPVLALLAIAGATGSGLESQPSVSERKELCWFPRPDPTSTPAFTARHLLAGKQPLSRPSRALNEGSTGRA